MTTATVDPEEHRRFALMVRNPVAPGWATMDRAAKLDHLRVAHGFADYEDPANHGDADDTWRMGEWADDVLDTYHAEDHGEHTGGGSADDRLHFHLAVTPATLIAGAVPLANTPATR